ncbi:Malate/lactate/ureidoglycolate dehydrogenase, LDH2 family [Roseovarius nanhaiticus]|uniref:Malate/lactate/ureidoglycolate dehydrogenase, LDH2 family n=1 Tax=Roseovarius nanhaiticus TaxID=573024 RepID=A0A1N7H029_9RHOB|nr:Ldh family oxidoreductase [Roseovarius nanhaiticus]SEL17873.1 Malate/lactate/ureidoglycolate dehydrogenase, LDH2 family [Roseovarius nanhaiticus]SIS18199.1 Malate/lactate/ureidoglycolate dehydrogenase, LDH2 family [Roseovarius nanhaiticus]
MTDTILSHDDLTARVSRIFQRAGLSPLQSDAVARTIAAGERDACKSHGIYRIDGCLRTIKAGMVTLDAVPELAPEDGAIVRVAAHGGFSNAAFELGAPELARRAKELGMAALVINDCTHFAALWPEIEALTAHDLAAMAMCPSYSSVAPTGGNEALMGTNPFAFGWPRENTDPYVFDFATSVAARGEIELHRRAGTPLPEGWAVDADGNPTSDPEAALNGAMLPFGGHKGSAIATMIELLAGVMIGDLNSREALDRLGNFTLLPAHGELILAFDPARFSAGREGNAMARAETLFDAITGQGARLPSQRRFAARKRAMAHGITLSAEEIAHLDRLEERGLDAVA